MAECTVSGNSAREGGGIDATGGAVVTGCARSAGTSRLWGRDPCDAGSTMSCGFDDPYERATYGGGINADGGAITVVSSTISENVVHSAGHFGRWRRPYHERLADQEE